MPSDLVMGCGVVCTDAAGYILIGKRSDGQGWCLPGGKIDPGETSMEAAARELQEESGLIAEKLTLIGTIKSQAYVHGVLRNVQSDIYKLDSYTCTEESLQPNGEMLEFKFAAPASVSMCKLFTPTRAALTLYFSWLAKQAYLKIKEKESIND